MNPDTRIGICCYAGDAEYVIQNLPLYLHHECPITVLSPDDSRADMRYPGIENRFGGKRAYIGQDCLDRMRIHLRMLLDHPENHFLIHDSDSICLSPKLPDFLYDEPDTLWSNRVFNDIPEQQRGFPSHIPHVAFQPPWFMSRKVIQNILDASEGCTIVNPYLPFIDYWLVETAVSAGIPWKPLPYAISSPLSHDIPEIKKLTADALHMVRENGLIFLHSIKGKRFADPYVAARLDYIRKHDPKAEFIR